MDEIMIGEKPGQYKAYMAYRETGDIESGYKRYMQENLHAGLSFKGYLNLATKFHWVVRSNNYHEAEELRIRQSTRRKNLYNNLTAEDVKKELFTVCLEQIDLNPDMEHNDIAKYLKIAVDIGKVHDEGVIVNVQQNQGIVDIDDSILKELGKKLVAANDSD